MSVYFKALLLFSLMLTKGKLGDLTYSIFTTFLDKDENFRSNTMRGRKYDPINTSHAEITHTVGMCQLLAQEQLNNFPD